MLAATFNTFMEVFGDLSLGTVVLVSAALFFAWGIVKKTQKGIIDHYEKQKEATEKLQQTVDAVAKYPEYRQQSINKQKEIQDALANIKQSVAHLESRLDALEHEKNERELNRLRENLIYNYRFYANKEKNPLMAWSEMEKDSFYKLFRDYENLGGDGFMHTVVQPAMDALHVIPMHETEELDKLMSSRK
jgi:septal ring factor EnvC (AmiA/AmiB activator)